MCCLANTAALFYVFYIRPAAISIDQTSLSARFSLPGFDAADRSYALIFSTGRSSTRHIASLLCPSPSRPHAVITHQDAGEGVPARVAVQTLYRPLLAEPSQVGSNNEASFNESADSFVRDKLLPGFHSLMAGATDRNHNPATRIVYTGHLPLAFGLGPSLVRAIPPGALRVLRLRRDRLSAAASLMALGPETEDPWAPPPPPPPTPPSPGQSLSDRRRWFPAPHAPFVRLRVSPHSWQAMNRFQRWLWFVDDVECRWQALKADLGNRFTWQEESLESLTVLDGGQRWRRVAHFLGVAVRDELVGLRENTIQQKGRAKLPVGEAQLRAWDEQYRTLVGVCDLSGDGSRVISWQPTD